MSKKRLVVPKKPKEVRELEGQGWLAVLHTGTFVDSSGATCVFAAADLEEMEASYDPTVEEAPLVIGHPKTDAPAWGWVSSVKKVGDWLLCQPHKVAKVFKDAVNEGRFNKISVKLEDNQLKHVGFLGAALPAVPGLGSATLSAPTSGRVIELALGDSTYRIGWKLVTVGRIFQRWRDMLIEDKGVEAADKIISQWQIEDLLQEPKPDPTPNSFSLAVDDDQVEIELSQGDDPMMSETEKAELEALRAANAQLTGQVTELTAAAATANTTLKNLQTATETAQNAAWEGEKDTFCTNLQGKGIAVPADFPVIKKQLDLARADGKGEFAAGKNASLDQVKAYLLSQKPKIKVGAAPVIGRDPAPTDAVTIAKRAQEFVAAEQKAGRVISVADAVAHVSKDQPAA